MTDKLREAAEQALEAMEWVYNSAPGWLGDGVAAVRALREALADTEPRSQCAETCERPAALVRAQALDEFIVATIDLGYVSEAYADDFAANIRAFMSVPDGKGVKP